MTSLSLRAAAGKKKSATTPPSSTPLPAPSATNSKSTRNNNVRPNHKKAAPQSSKNPKPSRPYHSKPKKQQQQTQNHPKEKQQQQTKQRIKKKEENIQSTPLSTFPPIPSKPWTMCSPSEGKERSRLSMELSDFEYISTDTSSSFTAPPPSSSSSLQSFIKNKSRQKVEAHAQLCIQKYRRSAAGGGVTTTNSDEEEKRSLVDLVQTVNYLLGRIVPFRCVTLTSATNPKKWWEEEKVKSLSTTANFVEDRLRAVQVDLVPHFETLHAATTTNNSTNNRKRVMMMQMQARIIRHHILFLHLLSNTPSKMYEMKFGVRALHTALSCYFDLAASSSSSFVELQDLEREELDEMLSYEALLHISSIIRQRELALPAVSSGSLAENMSEYGSGYTAILLSFQRFQHLSSGKRGGICELYPKWSFALKVANSADVGNYNQLLRLLSFTYDDDNDDDATKKQVLSEYDKRWQILCRCCIAKSLNVVRIGAVRQYNKCFGKQEEVLGDDLTKLLHLPDAKAAIQFCQHVGLPTGISSKMEPPTDGHHNCVIMKAAPISITDPNAIQLMDNPGRCEDLFVFGKQCLEVDWKKDHFLTGVDGKDGVAFCNDDDDWEKDGHSFNDGKKDILQQDKQIRYENGANDNWEERDWDEDLTSLTKQIDKMSLLSASETTTKNRMTGKVHVDQEGVVIPPDYAIWSIIK